MEPIEMCENPLVGLYRLKTHREKLGCVHKVMRTRSAGIERIAVALYDQKSRMLKTFIASPAEENPLKNYEIILDKSSSLLEVAKTCRPRIIHDLKVIANSQKRHSLSISGHGFASSYTYPMYLRGELTGFIFFDSMHKRYFRDRVLEQVEIFAHLVAEVITNDLAAMRALIAALRTAISMVHMRDPETGNHLERMARYSRLIAKELVHSGTHELDDEQIEQIFQFAPLHDVGKIGIPDQILQKPTKLDATEREVMNTHTRIGRQIVDELIDNFGFDRLPYINYLRNIVEQHHESMDGSGYPQGLTGKEIALEARIVAVSDIYDALTSRRPYKSPWSNKQALSLMQLMAIDKLDRDCVIALTNCQSEARLIQEQFIDAEI